MYLPPKLESTHGGTYLPVVDPSLVVEDPAAAGSSSPSTLSKAANWSLKGHLKVMWFPLHRRHVTIFPLAALGASSASASLSLSSCCSSASTRVQVEIHTLLETATGLKYMFSPMIVVCLSNPAALPLSSPNLISVLYLTRRGLDVLGPSLPLCGRVGNQAGLHLPPDSSRSLKSASGVWLETGEAHLDCLSILIPLVADDSGDTGASVGSLCGCGQFDYFISFTSTLRVFQNCSPSISSSSAQSVFDLDATAAIVVDWLMLIGI